MDLDLVHNVLEIGALGSLAALCVFEVAAFRAGRASGNLAEDLRAERAKRHHRLEIAALASLALLVVTDVGAYIVGGKVEEMLRARVATVETSVRPRTVSPAQATQLATLLRAAPGKVTVVSRLMDGESTDFANNLRAAFKNAAWEIGPPCNASVNELPGYVVVVPCEAIAVPNAERVCAALSAIGIECRRDELRLSSVGCKTEGGVVYVIVGRKAPEM